MDDWYEELVGTAKGFGLERDFLDQFEEQYDRRLEPLRALILAMYDAGFCSQDGDFGPELQGISENDRKAMGCEEEDDDEAQ